MLLPLPDSIFHRFDILLIHLCDIIKWFCIDSSGGKKKQLLVDKPDDDLVAGPYDAMDDYDFM